MPYHEFVWTDEIIEHLAEHDISPEEFEEIVSDPDGIDRSRSTGAMCSFGETVDGRNVICVYDLEPDGITVIPRTAYEVRRRGQ